MNVSPASLVLPSGYPRVKCVGSFAELVATPFGPEVNALCWPRTLVGDFEAVVAALGVHEEITTIEEEDLRALRLGMAGRLAVETLLADQQRLREHGLEPVLDCIPAYPKDEVTAAVPTDVYSFHADSAPVQTDTYLCSYTVAASEGLRNDEARRCVDVPELRARLLHEYGGEDDAGFSDFLHEHCLDLHYVPAAGAQEFSFGLGHLWRIAVEYPGSPVPPCVHRAPATSPGQLPRLLLIS